MKNKGTVEIKKGTFDEKKGTKKKGTVDEK